MLEEGPCDTLLGLPCHGATRRGPGTQTCILPQLWRLEAGSQGVGRAALPRGSGAGPSGSRGQSLAPLGLRIHRSNLASVTPWASPCVSTWCLIRTPDVGLGLTQIRWDLDSLYPQSSDIQSRSHSGGPGGRGTFGCGRRMLFHLEQSGEQAAERLAWDCAFTGRRPAPPWLGGSRQDARWVRLRGSPGDAATWAADGRAGGGASGEAGLRGSCFKIHQTRAIFHPR